APFVHRLGQHFSLVATVLQRGAPGGAGLWNAEEEFYFDVLRYNAERMALRIHSMVGLVPLFAAMILEQATLDRVPALAPALEAILRDRPYLKVIVPAWVKPGRNGVRLLSVVDRERLTAILRRVLDESQFLSGYGVRSLSRIHQDRPYRFAISGQSRDVRYVP